VSAGEIQQKLRGRGEKERKKVGFLGFFLVFFGSEESSNQIMVLFFYRGFV